MAERAFDIDLVTTRTADDVELDGAFYMPRQPKGDRPAVLMVHGLTWNFYRGPARWLSPMLAEAGLPTLSLNMRDHDEKESRDFELSHHDIAAGLSLAASLSGRREVVVVAHGYACNKVIAFPSLAGAAGPARIVLTTLGAIHAYRPDIWASVLTRAADLRGEALVIQGAIDPLIEAEARARELAAAAQGCRTTTVVLAGGDHYFNDRHRELADAVIGWIGGAS